MAEARRSRGLRPRSGISYLLVAPAVLLVSLLFAGLLDLLWRSFHSFDPYLQEQGSLSAEQYVRATTGSVGGFYMDVLVRTVTLSIAVTVASVILALPIAYVIVRLQSRWLRLIALTVLLIPFLMGEVVRAFAWLVLFGRDGLIVGLFEVFGGDAPRLLGTAAAIWVGMIQMMVPIAALVLLPIVRRIHPDLERAGQTLGARPWRIWAYIVVPLALPGVLASGIVVFSLSMTSFAIPDVLGLGRLPFIANTIQDVALFGQNMYLASALGVVLLVIVTSVVVVFVLIGTRVEARTGR